jgi:tetratricopeptide (TPR) repeat protein/MinD-like ATPase involved in chromosome partitioning or flagellar assembly
MIYTFYSYKGGVGRSMALANVAELLYRCGLKVLMVDFDLEAPGLERYFDVPEAVHKPTDILKRRGIIDLVLSYKELRSLPQKNPARENISEFSQGQNKFPFPIEPITNFMVPIYNEGKSNGTLHLIPPGRRAEKEFAKYAERIRSFDWNDFYANWDGEQFFNWLREELRASADIILVDSRTGVTEMSGVCTHQLADSVVMFVSANQQNLDGTLMVARSLQHEGFIQQGRKGEPIPLVFVPSRIEQGEADLHDDFSRRFNLSLGNLFAERLKFEKGPYLDLKIPYVPYYSYMEKIAVRATDQPSASDLNDAYERLVVTLAQLAPKASRLNEIYDEEIGKLIPRAYTITTGDIGQAVSGTAVVNVYQYVGPESTDAGKLVTAQEKLSALPIEELPKPAPLPSGSRMVFSRNPLFAGREEELHLLARTLKVGDIVAITGLGGIGKTQLAIEFVHRYGQFFAGGVFWISFADANSIPVEIALCGGLGGLNLRPDFESLSLAEQVQLVSSAWQSPLPRLLVFDNCEEENLLVHWRPSTGGCRVLITSRRGQWSPSLGVQTLLLGILQRNESIQLLNLVLPDLDVIEAEAIAEELGDLPLALYLAGSFLVRYGRAMTPRKYLEQLRDKGLLDHPSLQGRATDVSPTGHDLHLTRTLALSYEQLDVKNATDLLAIKLLTRAACFAPGEPIPRELLVATVIHNDDDIEQLLQVEDALTRLETLGLLTVTEVSLLLHRLVATFVKRINTEDNAQSEVENALYQNAKKLNHAGYPAPLLAWQVHLRYVTDEAISRMDERAAALCNELGYHLVMIAEYEGAQVYYERALAINEKVLGPTHPDTALIMNNLALLLQDRGDYAVARPYYERALAINENVLGPEHPDTARSLNNLGLLLQAMGDHAAAQPYYERALAINEKVLGPMHPDTALIMNNLALLLQDRGDHAAARSYYERAFAINEKVLGPTHPDTARSLNNLGLLLQAMGDHTSARPYFEQALAINEKVLGPEHPDTARSLNNLGSLLNNMGDYAAARPYYERALAINEKVLGPEHPGTARSLNNLGSLLNNMGDHASARPYYERALAINEKVLGPEHPDTARSLNNLGLLLNDMGDHASARPYYERALAINEKVLGPEHPDTALSLNNMGLLLNDMGDHASARPYYERALAINEKVLGPEHPDTALSLNNLGSLLQAMGDHASARPYFERALAINEKVLGPEHPDTALSLNNLGSLLQAMGDHASARPYYEQALVIWEKVLGLEHPYTRIVRNNLTELEKKIEPSAN